MAFWLTAANGTAQEFSRTRLMVDLENPWEIVYGPDDHLWISENGGKVVRVEPATGVATVVFTASDYFPVMIGKMLRADWGLVRIRLDWHCIRTF